MTVNKLALFEAAKSLWPATIDLTKDPDGPHDIYWALERIVPVDDDWQQIAMWSFHHALDEMEKRAAATGVSVIAPCDIQFAEFDKCMRSNLAGDECWAIERAFWESDNEQEQ
ncbi:hypothetical protein [Sphingomonas hylomeconis]|uniref:Uncharacterized protein n=1 Tax=Sphingomonas hylomeconis TaxID=1395958 RepID=A0ABV7SQU9_9SPHN|nr:hypothetical protein [Sphingomonas hylomeconis]